MSPHDVAPRDDDPAAPEAAAASAARPEGHGEAPSMIGLARSLAGELPGLVSDRVHLFALELRRSGLALAKIVAWAVAAAVLLSTAWLALWVGLGVGAIRAGWTWYWVLAGILLLNVAVAWFAIAQARALAPMLALPATLRRLTLAPAPQPTGEVPTAPVAAVPPGQPLQASRTLH